MIGVEPTRREALAPETSVSTISPHARQKSGHKDMNNFQKSKIYFISVHTIPAFDGQTDFCQRKINGNTHILQIG